MTTAPEVAPVTRQLTQPMLNAYADASGDHNPIHIDEAFAKTTAMGGTIAHGMLVLSFISEMMTGAFGRAWLAGGRLDVRFRAPSRPGVTVTARARYTETKDGRHRYAVECVSQTDEVLIAGTAELPGVM
ncbi:MAG TPA: MaoC/PaaZ C-terminal domain-containing protein [Dehalococcoidia bacterium]|nr:MaoC/PaaZ C-terminal domain-containing protein [Dehalococcoidia bacterium]